MFAVFTNNPINLTEDFSVHYLFEHTNSLQWRITDNFVERISNGFVFH